MRHHKELWKKFELIFSLRQGLGEEELKAVFFFIELVAYECIYNALMSDCPSKDQKWDSNDNFN